MSRQLEPVVDGRLGAAVAGVDGIRPPADQVLVEPVLEIALAAVDAIEPAKVAVVVAEQQLRRPVRIEIGVEIAVLEQLALDADGGAIVGIEGGASRVLAPGPEVAEPELRQQVDHRRRRRPVMHRDPHQDVFRTCLGVFDHDIEVAVVVEHAGVEQLELGLVLAAPPVLCHQPGVREFPLRIFVEILQVRVGRGGVEIIIELLDVLAVVALAVGQAEQPFLQDRVLAVPERQRQAQPLMLVAEPGDAVLAPAIGPRARLVVREILPGVAVGAVVLAHGAPLALAEIGPPALPAHLAAPVLGEPRTLGGRGRSAWARSAPRAWREHRRSRACSCLQMGR